MDSISEIQRSCSADSDEWFPQTQDSLPFMALAMAGEVGEFCNLVKKIARGSVDLDVEVRGQLIEELTDVFIYLANIANLLQTNLGVDYDIKRQFNAERFGTGHTGGLSSVDGAV